jgi:ABC-2 type transport system ATP-binding protein
MPPAIETHALTKRYRATLAVDALDLVAPAGQLVGFLGPNGAGKSTTIAMLLGLTRPTGGRVILFGHDAARHRRAVQPRIGALFEPAALYPFLSAREHLQLYARLARRAPAEADALLARVGLTAQADQPARTLSLGQRQRLGLALALLGQPDLLILDEPTNGLDPAGVRQVHDLLRAFVAAGGTVFFSSHRLAEVQDLCRYVVILSRGRLVAQGEVAALLQAGRRGRLLLRVSEPDRALALLAAASWPAEADRDAAGPLLRVAAPAGRAAEVNALLAGHGVGVAELRAEATALEDLFLQLTGAAHA